MHKLSVDSLLVIWLLISVSLLFFIRSSYCIDTRYYTIKVREGDWVEYVVSKIFGVAIVPVEFESTFPRVWVSLNESSTFLVKVIEKKLVDFGNYTREFAIFNVSLDGKQLIPFWFFEAIQTVRSLPLDGLTFFLPVNESFWDDFESMVGYWANKTKTLGFQIYYDVSKCFYRIRAEHLMVGWLEAFANYDGYYGVLIKFGLSFALTQEFVSEINQRVGTITVDGKPFQIEAGKRYGMEIAINDSNIGQLLNSIQFGLENANLLDKALNKGNIGALITVKKTSKGLISSLEAMDSAINVHVNVSSSRIVVEVESAVSDGKVFVIYLRKDAIPIQWSDEFEVLVNGMRAPSAENYEDVLNIDEESPEHFILYGPEFVHIAVSIPHFSTVTIEIKKTSLASARLLLYVGIGGIIIIGIFGAYMIRRRRIWYRTE